MAITFNKKTQTFELSTNDVLYVFRITKTGYLRHVYFGQKRKDYDELEIVNNHDPYVDQEIEERFSLSGLPNEYSAFGLGDYREVAIKYTLKDGTRNNNLKYKKHEILNKKSKIDSLPSLEGKNELIVTLADKDIEIELHYSVYEKENVITRRTVILNHGDEITINTIHSFCLDLKDPHQVVSLNGMWADERRIVKHFVDRSILTIDSKRGFSSHHANNFIAISDTNTDEDSGLAIGLNLVYSGSFTFKCEHNPFNDFRVVGGINDYDFSCPLKKNEKFETPEVVISYSNDGFNKMSQQLHDVYRNYLMNKNFVNKQHPIVLNNWEATRADFTEQKLIDLIESAKGLGIDTFVLDDGWFGKRNDDTTSLGDWDINKEKLPNGLTSIIDVCKRNGLKFGLWIEPEMISKKSELYKKHPDWAYAAKGGNINLQRQQMVLNLTKPEVRKYIKDKINKLLDENEISYIKWDCNRYLSEYYADNLKANEQTLLFHKNIIAVYKMMDEIILSHPNVFFEGCCAGGGRIDPGILPYFPQSWCSDNSDAYSRQFIQYGTSYAYPLSTFSGHVSVCPNKQVGTVTPFAARCDMASLCSTGYELDITKCSEEERKLIKSNNERFAWVSPLLLEGDLFRILNPFETNHFGQIVVSKDKNKAFAVFACQKLDKKEKMNVKFKGLDKNKKYFIKEINARYSGHDLMKKGINITFTENYETKSFSLETK